MIEKKGIEAHRKEVRLKFKEEMRERRNERVEFFIASALAGAMCFGLIIAILAELTGEDRFYDYGSNPILLLIAGVIAAYRIA